MAASAGIGFKKAADSVHVPGEAQDQHETQSGFGAADLAGQDEPGLAAFPSSAFVSVLVKGAACLTARADDDRNTRFDGFCQAFLNQGRHVAASEALDDDAGGTIFYEGFHEERAAARVHFEQEDLPAETFGSYLRAGRGQAADNDLVSVDVAERPPPWGLEGVRIDAVRLDDVRGRENTLVHDYDDAEPPGAAGTGYADGAEDVGRTVGADAAGRAQGAGQRNGFFLTQDTVEKIRRFLDCVRAVCDDTACHVVPAQGLPDLSRQAEHERGRHLTARDVGKIADFYVGHGGKAGHGLNEIRAGAGGDEAALFASELYRMYVNYAEHQHWKVEMISVNENGIGGFKEVVCMITGKGAYSKLKYESGVHRVQRVPETESGGRIHTSTATVAVMPEAEEVDVQIDMNDCRIDVMRASGNGGQCVNTTDSAVRLTHIPTGIVIYSQTEKSQLQNKEKAFRLLRSKLYDIELEKRQNAEAEERRSQIGTGDRSEKIRTYNFPQGRVTEHRIKLTLYKIDSIMNGDIQEIIDSLIAADQSAKLAKMNEEN